MFDKKLRIVLVSVITTFTVVQGGVDIDELEITKGVLEYEFWKMWGHTETRSAHWGDLSKWADRDRFLHCYKYHKKHYREWLKDSNVLKQVPRTRKKTVRVTFLTRVAKDEKFYGLQIKNVELIHCPMDELPWLEEGTEELAVKMNYFLTRKGSENCLLEIHSKFIKKYDNEGKFMGDEKVYFIVDEECFNRDEKEERRIQRQKEDEEEKREQKKKEEEEAINDLKRKEVRREAKEKRLLMEIMKNRPEMIQTVAGNVGVYAPAEITHQHGIRPYPSAPGATAYQPTKPEKLPEAQSERNYAEAYRHGYQIPCEKGPPPMGYQSAQPSTSKCQPAKASPSGYRPAEPLPTGYSPAGSPTSGYHRRYQPLYPPNHLPRYSSSYTPAYQPAESRESRKERERRSEEKEKKYQIDSDEESNWP